MSQTTQTVEPWAYSADAYTADALRLYARRAAKDKGGRLIDWRLLVGSHGTTLQTRVRRPDGAIEYHNTAL